MKWTPPTITGAAVLLVVTAAAIHYLPSEPAWSLLGQLVAGASRVVFGP